MPEDLSLREIKKISLIIVKDLKTEAFNITSTLDGDSRAMPYRYLLAVYGKKSQSVENYNKPDSLYVITRDSPTSVISNTLFEIASFQPSNVAKVWEIKGNIRLVKLSKKEKLEPKIEKFLTIVNPVRARELWDDKSMNSLLEQIEMVKKRDYRHRVDI